MKQKNLLFDLDGTLIDSSEGIYQSINYAMSQMGHIELSQSLLKSFIGPPLLDSFLKLGFSDEQAQKAVYHYRENYGRSGIYQIKAYAGIDETLKKLSETHDLFLATSKPEKFAKNILNHLKFFHYFTGIYGADLEGVRSKKKDVIRYALSSEKVDASDALMIGDREHDIKGALANNVAAIGVLYGFGDKDELQAAGALQVVVQPLDLIELLNGE